jgi:pimeloyl-ACP methyl ester carboxylesterase
MKLQVNGREVYAYTGGKAFDAQLPCVVFVHGALHDHTVFTLLARWCAHHGYGVLALDLPGHMRSAGPALQSVEAMAQWVWGVLDAAGVRRAALVGHSMGSLVALEAASLAPARASRLVMLGTAYPMAVSPALLKASRDAPLKAIDMVVNFSYSTLAAKPSYPGPGVWLRGSGRALMRQVLQHQGDAALFHTDFSACDAYGGGLDAAARVSCPTHLVLGRADQMTPRKAALNLAGALRAQVREVSAGHVLMAENPDAVLHCLRSAMA